MIPQPGAPAGPPRDPRHIRANAATTPAARPDAPGVYTRIGSYLGWLWEKSNGAVGEDVPVTPDAPTR